ncbi:flagellar protein FlaG [Pseudoalteromonas aliena]|uniref:flagellar protein FlaG n=1 Tax=Pseudoalteromonas aliena TaxID=247523 RepID=UPI00311E848D
METPNISLQAVTPSKNDISKHDVNRTPIHDEIKSNAIEHLPSEDATIGVGLNSPDLEKVAQQLQTFMNDMNKGLEFHVDEDSGRNVIKVVDKESGDLVKQYPSEEVLEIVSNLAKATGALVDFKV